MPLSSQPIRWGEWHPDLFDANAPYTSSILNVLPRADGYMPVKDYAALTDTLPGPCRGLFFARNAGVLMVFAATETRLYRLDNTTLEWVDVSKGGNAYSSLSSNAQWQFVQFNNVVIAVQENTVPQAFNTTSSSAFADLGGSPPEARYVSIINRFVVLSGLLDNPYRVQWSGLNAITTWTSGTNFSDFQDLPDGGIVRGVVGGEFGIIVQDLALRRMIHVPGSDIVFQIDRISRDTGTLAPYSIINGGESVFFLSPRGFVKTDQSGVITPIGKERVDRTFLRVFDDNNLQLVIAASDPAAHLIYWTYKSADGGANGEFDKIICYDWALDRWSLIEISGQFIAPLASPGLTMESLDALAPGALAITDADDNGSGLIRITVASTTTLTDGGFYTISDVGGVPNADGTWEIDIIDGTDFDLLGSTFSGSYTSGGIVGGSLDAMTQSLDTFAVADLAQISIASTDNSVGFFQGDNLEAVLETPEQTLSTYRLLVNGIVPLTDSPDAAISIAMRDNLSSTATYGDESTLNIDGYADLLEEGRYLRAKMRVPAGSAWSFATGVHPDTRRAGQQ